MVLLERFWVRSRTHPTPALAAARLNVVDREASSGSASKQTQEPRKHPMNGARVLLVEDDLKLANLVKEYLEKSDCVVEIEGRGDRAVARILGENPDLVVLDLNLPGLDGLSVCREVRGKFSNPILMLTARGEETDEVLGLEMGADDYMAKPFSVAELLQRLRARVPCGIDEGETSEGWCESLEACIAENLSSPEFDVKKLAEMLGYSERQLLRRVMQHAGEKPSALILSRRLERAHGLIESKRYETLAEVAHAVGLSPGYFSRCYRRMLSDYQI